MNRTNGPSCLALLAVSMAGCSAHLDVADPGIRYDASCATAPKFDIEEWQGDDRARLQKALEATWSVVTSPEFQESVASVRNLHETVGGLGMPGPQVLAIYLHARLPVRYVHGGSSGETADTGPHGREALTVFGTANLARWPDDATTRDGLLRRACLINTIAHEWTHAVPGLDGNARFKDDGHRFSTDPLVSYALGSIAQCVYLEQNRIISPAKYWQCVDAVGTKDFNGLTVCEHAEWLQNL